MQGLADINNQNLIIYEFIHFGSAPLPLARKYAGENIFKIFAHDNYFLFRDMTKITPTATFSHIIAPMA